MPATTRRCSSTPKEIKKVVDAVKGDCETDSTNNLSWGRSHKISLATNLGVSLLFFVCPLMVLYFWMSCHHYGCSLSAPIHQFWLQGADWAALRSSILSKAPKPTLFAFQIYGAWVACQALMYAWLPGPRAFGQMTPAGHLLEYRVNGLLAWCVSHALFIAGSLYFKLFEASVIHDNWGPLIICANVFGYAFTFFAYFKALLFPTHADDRKFSGSFIYDLFMGIELNPRIGKLWDFKLFTNGRPGIIAWTLINFSFAAAQYNKFGYVTNSMLLVLLFHWMYVIDFFINESWYLRTIDIAHDHYSFYLAWGSFVWLPVMYTLQAQYLAVNPVQLSTPYAAFVLAMGLFGYYLFRSVNHQKDFCRLNNGDCQIWGRPAKVVRAKYQTSDGKTHTSILLASGWWSVARHMNYTGDLILSLAMCLSCGFQHAMPYFYIIYLTILLMNRIQRDEGRCSGKYGKYWVEYKNLVPYNIIPYVY